MAGISRRALLTLAGQAVLAYAAAPFVRAASVTPLFHGPRDARLIALTIDDDWSAARVGSIFDTLQRASVAATFFPYAEATRSDPGLWRAITAAGYPYANHTRTHPWMTRLTPKAQAAEITEARTILEGITGSPMLPDPDGRGHQPRQQRWPPGHHERSGDRHRHGRGGIGPGDRLAGRLRLRRAVALRCRDQLA